MLDQPTYKQDVGVSPASGAAVPSERSCTEGADAALAQGGLLASSPVAKAVSKPITRRDLIGAIPGAAAGAAALAAVGVAIASTGCSSSSDSDDDGTPTVLEVATNAVVTLESYTEIEDPDYCCIVDTFLDLPEGIQLFTSGDRIAAALCTGETARPLSTVALMSLEAEEFPTVLEQAVSQDEGYNIYEVRASDDLLVWVESNFLTDDWRVYSASIDPDELTIGEPTLLDEGDADYDAPEIAAVANQAYWIVQPSEDGAKTTEDSVLKTNGGVAYTSHGRFNGGLSTSGNSVICMPRADSSSSVYYQLTAIQNGSVVATQVLPHGFRPSTATYVDGSFSFGISAGYDYGDGIANVGTYISAGDGTWLRLTRTPVTPAGRCNGWFFCKSSSRTVFVDTKRQRYFTISAPSGTESYGDYSIRTGECDGTLFNYATVSELVENEYQRKVVVRSIKLVKASEALQDKEDQPEDDGSEDSQ